MTLQHLTPEDRPVTVSSTIYGAVSRALIRHELMLPAAVRSDIRDAVFAAIQPWLSTYDGDDSALPPAGS